MELFDYAALVGLDDESLEEAAILTILQRRRRYLGNNPYPRLNVHDLREEDVWSRFRFKLEHVELLHFCLHLPYEITCGKRLVVSSFEALLILLRRLAYPNRLKDLENEFGRSQTALSLIANTMCRIILLSHGHLLQDLGNLHWLTEDQLKKYSQVVNQKGAPLNNCWAFIDGTARAICRPREQQQLFYSGHKRFHCLKYQSLCTPDGLIVSLHGPYHGRRHDSGIFGESPLYEQLRQNCVFGDRKYIIYGDPAYPIRELLLKPYSTVGISAEEGIFNKRMSAVRLDVEWGFGKVIRDFAFLDFKKNQKLLMQKVGDMYHTAVLLSNCHSCLYGNQCTAYFEIDTVSLEEYLG